MINKVLKKIENKMKLIFTIKESSNILITHLTKEGWENLKLTGHMEIKKCTEETLINLPNLFVCMDVKAGIKRDCKDFNQLF